MQVIWPNRFVILYREGTTKLLSDKMLFFLIKINKIGDYFDN